MSGAITVDRLHRALGGEISRGKNGPQVVCPGRGHSHGDRSLAVAPTNNDDGFIVHSFAGDDPLDAKDYVREQLGEPAFQARKSERRETAYYDYTDEAGSVLFQVVRFGPKTFRQRRPDGRAGWIWNLEGVRLVPYRLPELIAALANRNPVFIVEGEKDVDRLWSLNVPATCNPQGAGKWRDDYSKYFEGATVYVLPDNDQPGRDHAQKVARSLTGVGATVRIVELAGLPERGDVYDFLKAGGTVEKLYEIANGAPEYSEDQTAGGLGAIFTFVGDAPAAPPRELIKKLIPAEGVVVTGGQSSAGKTFIQLHKSICLATGIPYFDHKIVERVGTAFIAAEGRPLMPNRFEAGTTKLAVTQELPICWPKLLPDFSSTEGIKLFVEQLKELDRRYQGDFGVRLGQIVVDTVAATFSMKDEDDNSEATKVCNDLRRIGDEIGALMAPVHHYGKNPESGLRGASAWRGSADVVEGVLADIDPLSGKASNRELVCAKARDGEQGPLSPFDLEFITLGMDADGDIYGSLCVVPAERESKFDKGKAPSKSQRTILDAVDEALLTYGKIIVPRADMPEVRAAKVSDIRIEFDRRYVVDDTDRDKAAHAKRMAFKRALDRLSPAKFGTGTADGANWIWRIN